MNTETRNLGGRPTRCTPEFVEKLCEIVATTPKGIEVILKEHPELDIDESTIRIWNRQNEDFRKLFSAAKEEQLARHLDHTIVISDEVVDSITDENCHPIKAGALVQAAKLRIETRQRYAEMLRPKIYRFPSKDGEPEKEKESLSIDERTAKVAAIFMAAKEKADKEINS